MTPKIVLVTIGILMTLQGIGLFLGAGSIEEYTDPTEAMLAMGARLNEAKGLMTLLVGVILLASFNIDIKSAKKVVVGTGIAMAISFAVTTEAHINHCQKYVDGIKFKVSDAENLNNEHNQFDVLLNVQSSH